MRAGKLRNRITVEQATRTQDSTGHPVASSWSTVAHVWARKRDLSGRELLQAQQMDAKVTTEFFIRYRNDVTAKMRVRYRGVHYNIVSVQATERETGLLLLTSRAVN